MAKEKRKLDKGLAATVFQDIEAVREICDKQTPTAAELRVFVGTVLRRLLIYRDLKKVADGLGIKLLFQVPDLSEIYSVLNSDKIVIWQSGGASLFGMQFEQTMLSRGGSPVDFGGFHPDSRIDLNFESFLRQRCIYLSNEVLAQSTDLERHAVTQTEGKFGRFATREDVIKYVANKLGSVHFDRTKRSIVLEKFQRHVIIQLQDDIPTLGVSLKPAPEFDGLLGDRMDPVLVELYATAKFVIESESVKVLQVKLRSLLND